MDSIEKKIREAGGTIISRPLVDDTGEIDPLCVAELMEELDKPTKPSLFQEPEWSKPVWTFKHEVVSAFAKCACRQSPYGVPDGLENVCKYLNASLNSVLPSWNKDGMAMASLNRRNDRREFARFNAEFEAEQREANSVSNANEKL